MRGCGSCSPAPTRPLANGSALLVTADHVFEVNRMVEALKPKDNSNKDNSKEKLTDELKDKLGETQP